MDEKKETKTPEVVDADAPTKKENRVATNAAKNSGFGDFAIEVGKTFCVGLAWGGGIACGIWLVSKLMAPSSDGGDSITAEGTEG